MKRRETIVVVSEDGTRCVGKSFVVDDNEAPLKNVTPTVEEINQVSEANRKLQNAVNDYARDCNNDAKEYGKQADRYSERAEVLKSKIKRAKARSDYFQRKVLFWKKTRSVAVISLAIIGFIAGVILAISQTLKYHGPTTTVLDTAVLFLICLVSGIVLCLILGWLTKKITDRRIKHYKELHATSKEILGDYISEEKLWSFEAENCYSLKDTKRKKSQFVWGLR